MSVDLADLTDSLKREVSPPGTDLYPDATDEEWEGHLRDAFWQGKMFGAFANFEENAAENSGGDSSFGEGIVTPVGAELGYDTSDDMVPELRQLVVLYAGYRVTLTSFQNVKAGFRTKAGPVEYEVQKSATLLKGVLDAIKEKIDTALAMLSDNYSINYTVLDATIQRTYAMEAGTTWFVNH